MLLPFPISKPDREIVPVFHNFTVSYLKIRTGQVQNQNTKKIFFSKYLNNALFMKTKTWLKLADSA